MDQNKTENQTGLNSNSDDRTHALIVHHNSCVKCARFPICPNPNKSKTHSCPQFTRRISPHANQS